MKLTRKLLSVAVVFLFLGIASAASVNAGSYAKSEAERTLTVYLPGITEDHWSAQVVVEQNELNDLNQVMDEFLVLVESVKEKDSDGGMRVTKDEFKNLKNSALDIIDSVKTLVEESGEEFPEEFVEGEDFEDTNEDGVVTIEEVVEQTILGLFSWNLPVARASIFSVGHGWAWIPFYDYESFIGVMLRPIFLGHIPGFTAVWHFNMLPPRFEYGDRLGIYRLRTLCFVGIFINFGDIGLDRVSGPMLLIGKSFNNLGEDFP